MAAEQDEHRNKRVKAAEETGSTSTLSTTRSTSNENVQPGSPTLPSGTLSNNPFAPNNHDSGGQASNHLIDDGVDSSSSKGKEVALPIRDRAEKDSAADPDVSNNEDADMMDAASVSADDEDSEMNTGESDDRRDEDGTARRSSPKGKGRALSISEDPSLEDSSPRTSTGARNGSNRVLQSIESDIDMDNEGSERSRDEHSTDSSGSEHSRDEDRTDNSDNDHSRGESSQDEGNDGDGVVGRDDHFVQFHWAATVHPPVQEFRVNENGTVDVRPEDAG